MYFFWGDEVLTQVRNRFWDTPLVKVILKIMCGKLELQYVLYGAPKFVYSENVVELVGKVNIKFFLDENPFELN